MLHQFYGRVGGGPYTLASVIIHVTLLLLICCRSMVGNLNGKTIAREGSLFDEQVRVI